MDSNNIGDKKQKKFSHDETISILKIWCTDEVQEKLSHLSKHQQIYQKISNNLAETGYNRDWKEIKNKINNLKSEYCKSKPHSGASPPDWPYFNMMHEVLHKRPKYNLKYVTESENFDMFDNACENMASSSTTKSPLGDTNSTPNTAVLTESKNVDHIPRKKPKRNTMQKLTEELIASEKKLSGCLEESTKRNMEQQQQDDEIYKKMNTLLDMHTEIAKRQLNSYKCDEAKKLSMTEVGNANDFVEDFVEIEYLSDE